MAFSSSATVWQLFPGDWSIVPEFPGVYGIMDSAGRWIYIGQAKSIPTRLEEHRRDTTHPMHGYLPAQVIVEAVFGEGARDIRERQLIDEYNPPANIRLRTGFTAPPAFRL